MKYKYTVMFRIIGTGVHHSEPFGDAPAAISAAAITYTALGSTYAPDDCGTVPTFGAIRHKACVSHKAEPRNKSFMVGILKTPR